MANSRLSGLLGFFFDFDKGIVRFRKVIVGDERSGGTIDTRDFERASHEASKAKGGIFRVVFLRIGRFMSLVNDNEAEILNRRKQG